MADSSSPSFMVRFGTRQQQYSVVSDVIQVPGKLRRMGLSQVINHLLGKTDSPLPFDFLINNTYLRTSLASHLQKHNISTEGSVQIEYVLALKTPDDAIPFPHDDWVSALDPSRHKFKSVIFTGCYDNVVRVWKSPSATSATAEGEEDAPEKKKTRRRQSKSKKKSDGDEETESAILSMEAHTGAVKAIASTIEGAASGDLHVVSASQDGTLIGWKVTPTSKTPSSEILAQFVGHEGSVESVDIHPEGSFVISGGWDASVKIWSLKASEEDEMELETKAKVKGVTSGDGKRRKIVDEGRSDVKSSLASYASHTLPVSAVAFSDAEKFVSASWDHSIRLWDLDSGITETTLNGNSAIHSLSTQPGGRGLVTGHADGSVRVWDPRADQAAIFTVMSSHKQWVSSVHFHPLREELFLSGSYDGTLKVWDMRSSTPMYTLDGIHDDKVLASTWHTPSLLVSGSADNTMKCHPLPK
eukprot:TRINITY_DN9231_c0_g1_i1.p1 TRINITY_DN9231_c0_g1~~TRINITY_DN9231_c0_g1_i1.p1  ORF type:complete len:471 (+),score=129.49 TRINITY_DN9231_c0_g1_i1:66-1478(+)